MTEPMDNLDQQEKDLLGREGTTVEELRQHHRDCPRVDVLLASRAGVLSDEVARKVASHVEKCRFCQVLVNDLESEGAIGATPLEERRVRERVLAQVQPRRSAARAGGSFFGGWFWTAGTITALAAAAVALMVWAPWKRRVGPAVAPAPVARQTPNAIPTRMLEWEKLPIRLEASSILVWRGKPRTEKEKYAAALTAALTPYKNDDFAEAAKQLSAVAKDFPGGIEAQLYLGVSRLKLEQNSEAIEPLTDAQRLGTGEFRSDAAWYLALADERTGNLREAEAELKQLCGGKNDYSARACSAAQALAPRIGTNP